MSEAVQILIGFGRQTHHKVQLDVVPAALKGDLAGVEYIFLADVLVDNITQALRTGLTCERQAAFAGFLYALHQFGGKAVRTKRRQRQADMPRLTIVEHALGQTGQLTVVTGRQRGQRDFLVTGVLEHRLRLLEQHFLGLGAQRTISVAGLTESAAARTAAE